MTQPNQNETAPTWDAAIMIIRNPECYSKDDVRKAAIQVLAGFRATPEIIHEASSLL